MSATRQRTIALPGNITVTILKLSGTLTAAALRAMLAAELYCLTGETTSPGGAETGYGAYVGTSAALSATTARCGVSLHHWTARNGRLDPDTVILINAAVPMAEPVRLLIEASIARTISTKYTILNTRTSAPTAAVSATRQQRLYAMHLSSRLADLILGIVFHPHPPAAHGGTTREQLIRLILNQDPARAMDVADLLHAARQAGITIKGESPAQRSRRDVTTRELRGGTGRPRLLRTHVDGRAVVYVAGAMTVRQARADYAASHPSTLAPPRTPAATAPAGRSIPATSPARRSIQATSTVRGAVSNGARRVGDTK